MSSAERTICIHGHFYQPPRENPWLETVEAQESAAPWHDWNDRITAECYAPNSAARIVNQQNEIIRILNNYARMSFNFGPTLLSWLEQNALRVHEAIVHADQRSQKRFSGHGSAMAQIYNHVIMPLSSTRDRITQVRWGIADFRHRFGRVPEGMWLPETAVDSESLDLLAQHGIKFVLLAPHQCARPEPKSYGSGERSEGPRLDRHAQRLGGHDAALSRAPEGRPHHQRLLLRWRPLASHRLRRPAQQRRRLCAAPEERLQTRQRRSADRPRGHGRRKLRPPSQVR